MRAGTSNSRVVDLRLDSAAESAAEAVKVAGDPAAALGRFLIRLGDYLQTADAARATAAPWVSSSAVRKTSR